MAAMIADLQLVDKTSVPSSQLSGGQKRKLRCCSELVLCAVCIRGHNYMCVYI